METDKSRPNKPRGPFIILVLIIVICLIAGGVFAYISMRDNRTTEEKLVDAIFEAAKADMGEVRTVIILDSLSLGMDDSDAAMIAEILKDLELVTLFRYDMDSRRIEGTMDVEIMGTGLMGMDFYLDKEYLMVDIPLLYDKALYIRNKELVRMIQTPMLNNMINSALNTTGSDVSVMATEDDLSYDMVENTLETFFGLMDRDSYETYEGIDDTVYRQMLSVYLTESLIEVKETEEGISIDTAYDQDRFKALMEDMTGHLSEDEAIHAYMEELVNRFFDSIIVDRNWLMHDLLVNEGMSDTFSWQEGVYEENLNKIRQEVLTGLSEEWEDILLEAGSGTGLDESKDDMIQSATEMASITAMNWKLNGEDALLSQLTSLSIDLGDLTGSEGSSADITIESELDAIGEMPAFEGVDFKDGIDVGTLDDMAIMDLVMEMQNNIFANVVDNPLLSELFYLQ